MRQDVFGQLKPRWGDAVIVAVVVVLSVVLGMGSILNRASDGVTATIVQDGVTTHTIDLSDVNEPIEIALDNGHIRILAEQGRIRFAESDCHNQICVYTGWISRSGQIAACLPNRILIKLEGKDDELDVVLH